MRKIALSALSLALALSFFPAMGLAENADAQDALAVSDISMEESVPASASETLPGEDTPDTDESNAIESKSEEPKDEALEDEKALISDLRANDTDKNDTVSVQTSDESSSAFARDIVNDSGNIRIEGNQVLSEDITIENSHYLSVHVGAVLTIPSGVTVTNNGIISNAGTIVNNGTIINNRSFASYGDITGTGSITGNKIIQQREPANPTLLSKSENSVTLAPIETTGHGAVEYGWVEGDTYATPNNWQTSTTFNNLKPSTAYTFYARYAGNELYEPAVSLFGTAITTKALGSGHIENVTVAADNYLGADFAMPADYFAEDVLPAYALQQNSLGKNVDIWMESARVSDGSVISLVAQKLDSFLPISYFSLTPYYQIDGEAPEALSAETKNNKRVKVKLGLPDSALNTDPSITREYKVICVYDGASSVLSCNFDSNTNELTFWTNRFASFGLAFKDTRDGKQLFPVMVRDSYADASGQGQYAEGDKVAVYAGEREGYVVEFWNAITAQGSVDFTYEGADRAEFTMPADPVMVSITWRKIGDINDVTDVEGNALQATLTDKGQTLAKKVLSEDAMAMVVGGMPADIWLKSSDAVSAEDAAVISDALNGATLVKELDLALFYRVNNQETQVHETISPVGVRFTLPDSAINTDPSKTRSYEVIRVHDGAAQVIPCTFDARSKTLTFETDRFSAYAVTCTDTVVDSGSQDSKAQAETTSASSLAATGDTLMPTIVLLALIAAAAAFVCGALRREKAAERARHARR